MDLEDFFERALEQFHGACADGGVSRGVKVAGLSFQVRAPHTEMLGPVVRALAHLPEAPRPDFTVHAWDDAGSGTRMPPPPWGPNRVFTNRGELMDPDPRYHTAYNLGADLLTMLEPRTGRAIYWTRDSRRLPAYERTAPMRALIHWMTVGKGLQLAHAAALGHSSGGVLMVGKGGSGKSTSALACLRSGLGYVADDYCLVDGDRAWSLYSSGRLLPSSLGFIKNLRWETPDDPKVALYLHEQCPEHLLPSFPVKAVLLPRVTGEETVRLSPTSTRRGVTALSLSTMAQLPGAGPESFAVLSGLVEKVPCYDMLLGPNIGDLAGTISRLLAELS
jgi:hypothetical protein